MTGDDCVLCGASPARGFASIGDEWYCHGDDDQRPTCYERGSVLLRGGVPSEAVRRLDAIWRESIDHRGSVRVCGSMLTPEGVERRKLRDRARQRARVAVRHLHEDEFGWLRVHHDYDTALRRLALAHPEEYETAYRAALDSMGYSSVEHRGTPEVLVSVMPSDPQDDRGKVDA